MLTGIYASVFPIIIAATVSTIVVKLKVFNTWRLPMDNQKTAWDGHRVFGDNKTWIGVVGLILFGAISMMLWGLVCKSNPNIAANNWFYRAHDNTTGFNSLVGALMGLMYAVAELPNSFMKRRQGIAAGETVSGLKGTLNIILDHTDSIFGCAMLMLFLVPLTGGEFFSLIVVGAMTHVFVNAVLVLAKVKKNI